MVQALVLVWVQTAVLAKSLVLGLVLCRVLTFGEEKKLKVRG